MQFLAAKVEETVLKPYIFRIFLLAEYRQRQLARRSQHLDFADIEFDGAGRQFRIFGARGTAAQLAVDPHDPFRAQLFGVLERRRIRIGDALRQAIMVAQIDEQHPAMVANTMAPAGQTNALVDIALTERAAGMGPVTMHDDLEGSIWRESEGERPSEAAEGLPEANRRATDLYRVSQPGKQGLQDRHSGAMRSIEPGIGARCAIAHLRSGAAHHPGMTPNTVDAAKHRAGVLGSKKPSRLSWWP